MSIKQLSVNDSYCFKHGVQPRCEINSADEAKYYIDLGVRHFCIGDELRNNMTYWNNVGGALKEIVDTL